MRKNESKEDILLQYIDAEDIRRAPEGFSSKVMSHIYMETKPVRAENRLIVPVVSAAVFLVLTVAALLVTERSLNVPEINWPGDFSFSLPDLGSRMRVPQITIYVIVGIAMITLLDSFLLRYFAGRKNNPVMN